MKVIKNNEELKSYIKNGVIAFNESIECNFDIDVDASIIAWNIDAGSINAGSIIASNIKARDINADDIIALNIKANNINAWNINAYDINADDIYYHASCISYKNIKCKSIAPRRENGFHKCLDGKLTILPKKRVITIDNKEIEISEESYQEFVKQFKD
jgi:hypothetical protein